MEDDFQSLASPTHLNRIRREVYEDDMFLAAALIAESSFQRERAFSLGKKGKTAEDEEQEEDEVGYLSLRDIETLQDNGYLSLAELHSFRDDIDGGYFDLEEVKKNRAKDTGYLALDDLRKARRSKVNEGGYLSVEEYRRRGTGFDMGGGYLSLSDIQNYCKDTGYLSISDLQKLKEESGYMTVEELAAGRGDYLSIDAVRTKIQVREGGYMSLDELEDLKGNQSGYVSIEDIAAARKRENEEPQYMTVNEMQALAKVVKKGGDGGYFSVGDITEGKLAMEFEERTKDLDPTYLSLEEMKAITGEAQLKAWIHHAVKKEVEDKKGGMMPPQGDKEKLLTKNQYWLMCIRDEIIKERLQRERKRIKADEQIARKLQWEEILYSQDKEAASERASLLALEKEFQIGFEAPAELKKSGTFLALGGSHLVFDKSDGEPQFEKFEQCCLHVIAKIIKMEEEITDEKGGLDPSMIFYSTVGVIRNLEAAISALGAASTLDLGDGIQKLHLHRMGQLVWEGARKVGALRTKKGAKVSSSGPVTELRSRIYRLRFLMDRLVNDFPSLEVEKSYYSPIKPSNPGTANSRISTQVTSSNWVCDRCTFHNQDVNRSCEICGEEKSDKTLVLE